MRAPKPRAPKSRRGNPFTRVGYLFGANDNRPDGVRSFAPEPKVLKPDGGIGVLNSMPLRANKNIPNKYLPVKRRPR